MIMNMGYRNEFLQKLDRFRKNMGSRLFLEDCKRIFGVENKELPKKPSNKVIEEKIRVAKSYISTLNVFNWVKCICVTGSIAAGTALKKDDIDFFVVVRNNTAWIYRGLMLLRGLKTNKLRFAEGGDVKDLICVNMIIEERGLTYENDIFNFHEIMYLIPIYKEDYINVIYSKNEWLSKHGVSLSAGEYLDERSNIFLAILNFCAFIIQLLYMYIRNHKPRLYRLWKNYTIGRIEFFPDDFKERSLSKLN